MGENDKKAQFQNALYGKRLPILTLDNKWYRLLTKVGKAQVKPLETQLNDLLKRQGKINTETKEIRKLKKQLMNDIVTMVDEAEQKGNKAMEKQIEKSKQLVEEYNATLEAYKDEEMELPGQIDKANVQLMLATMENCYGTLQKNTEDIREIAKWVAQIRVELKKQLIRKQEMEQKNLEIYSYMNDLFGADVVNLFDMKYNPKEELADGTKRPDVKPAVKPEESKSVEDRLAELNFAEKKNAEARSAQNQMKSFMED
ncbi:MAG: hypothetical protein NC251_08990 [Lachnoclostridium sp.]|nr:hypothetical protein [Lachnospira sp.]MCM1248552.1 hypothetical protein [Lachnoclostridium sp.]